LPDINTSDGSTVSHLVYKGGLKGASVEHYKVYGGGHAWPSLTGAVNSGVLGTFGGLGNTNQDFNASKEIWRFFSQYTLMSSDPSVGDFSPLVVTSIGEIANDNSLTVYPNPSNGIFNIALNENSNAVIKIVNVLGETILEKITTDNIITIDLTDYPEGIYFYQIANKTGALKSGKLMVQ
jgi:polyhydroxybutyrate depolymerase